MMAFFLQVCLESVSIRFGTVSALLLFSLRLVMVLLIVSDAINCVVPQNNISLVLEFASIQQLVQIE